MEGARFGHSSQGNTDGRCVVTLGGDPARPQPRVLPLPDGIGIRTIVAGGADDKLVGGLITPEGEFWTWRSGQSTEKRQVQAMSQLERAVRVKFPDEGACILEVACGTMHMLALARGGHVYSWGTGANGQLGHGTTESLQSPLLVRSLEGKGVCQIASGGAHSAGLCDNGQLYMWGWNNSGQLGLEDVELRKVPTHAKLFDELEVTQVACGLSHSAVLSKAERTVYTCGWNQYNQLGTGALWATRSEVPCKVDTLCGKGVTQVGCGGSNTVALCDTGEVWVWGWGEQGQLGLGSTTMCRYPTLLEELSDKAITDLVVCGSHSAARTRTGDLYTWGSSTSGQIGHDTATAIYSVPTLVTQFTHDTAQTVEQVAVSGGIRAGQTILIASEGRSGEGSYQPLEVPVKPAMFDGCSFTDGADAEGSSIGSKSSKKKKSNIAERKPVASVSTGSGRTKMKETIRAMEASVSKMHDQRDKHRKTQQKLLEQKQKTSEEVATLLGRMALCEDPSEAGQIEKNCNKLDKELQKISQKFFEVDKACAELEQEELNQQKELVRALQKMQAQQAGQADRRKEAMREQLVASEKEEGKLKKELAKLEKQLEPVTTEYMEAQGLVESDNASTIAECRRQQAFLNELESSYAGLLEEVDQLNKELLKKQNELQECDECMQQVKNEIKKTEAVLQDHPAREKMKACEEQGKALRAQADDVQKQLNNVSKETAKMNEAQEEFQGWLDHVESIIKDTEGQVSRQKKMVGSHSKSRQQAKAALDAQNQQGSDDASANKSAIEEKLQAAQAQAQELRAGATQFNDQMHALESAIASRSAELSQLHAAKAEAVTGKQFKQATQLSQRIRQLSESEANDGEALAELMNTIEQYNSQLADVDRLIDQHSLELMSLEQQASENNPDGAPPGSQVLQQAAAAASASGCDAVARFLELEVATLLACAQAAQGYPPEEWKAHYQSKLGGQFQSDDLADFAMPMAAAVDSAKPASGSNEDSSSSSDSSSSDSDND